MSSISTAPPRTARGAMTNNSNNPKESEPMMKTKETKKANTTKDVTKAVGDPKVRLLLKKLGREPPGW